MNLAKVILILVMYVGIFSYFTIEMMNLMVFKKEIELFLENPVIKYVSNMSLLMFILIYLFMLAVSYIELMKKKDMSEVDALFWKKILLIKPISGITAYQCCINIKPFNNRYLNWVIRISFNLRNISSLLAILSLLIIFALKEPNDAYLLIFIASCFIAITMHLIFEPLILIDACQRDREEWIRKDYYTYFAKIKSILGYGEYYKKYYGKKR